MTPASVKASYRRSLKEIVTIRRYTGTGTGRPRFDVACAARTIGDGVVVSSGNIIQQKYKIILLAEDLINKGFVLPVTTNDKALFGNKEAGIIDVDDRTRRVDGELIAIDLVAVG